MYMYTVFITYVYTCLNSVSTEE